MTRKLLVSCPVSPDGNLNPALVQWMFAVQGGTYPGWEITVTVCQDRPVVQSRNRLVKQFLETDCDVLLTVDSDQTPQLDDDPKGGLSMLLEAIEKPEVDIVNAITVRRTDNGPLPVINKMTGEYEAELFQEILDRPVGLHELSPTGVMGGAAIMVKRHVCEKFLDEGTPWFKDVFEWRVGKKFDEFSGKDLFGERYIGHDVWFFLRAHEMGFRSWVDTRVFWGHVKAGDLRDEFNREMELRNESRLVQSFPRALARAAITAWGAPEWAAPAPFVTRMMAEASRIGEGQMVVECGSGFTTLVLQELLPKAHLMSLEEDEGFFSEMTGRCNGALRQAPIEKKGEYDWYRLPKPPKPVGLVVCDGPKGSTRGGRYGALPELYEYLAPEFTILLDDAHRDGERAILHRWAEEYGTTAEIIKADGGRAFAIVKGTK